MPEYEITLTKAYTVRIKAESAESAARRAGFYTGALSFLQGLGRNQPQATEKPTP